MEKRILSEIWIYPIKSLGGIRLQSSKVLEKGLLYDRRWMLIDENDVFMTQRAFNSMALFKLSFNDNGFQVRFGGDVLQVPFIHDLIDTPINSNVFDDKVIVYEVSRNFSEWFSERLGLKCKLVFFPENGVRLVDPTRAHNGETVSFADGYPLLIIGQASLNELNTRLKQPVPMNRFRPNLVFTGGEPFEEDTWSNFKVGHNRFRGVKPCGRCVLTTINQETGEKGKEPLATLSRYRNVNGKVLFGQNVLSVDKKEIYEGDEIIVE